MTETRSPSIDCDRCNWPVTDGTKHDPDSDEGVCIVRRIDTEQTLGWKRRRQPVRKMYK